MAELNGRAGQLRSWASHVLGLALLGLVFVLLLTTSAAPSSNALLLPAPGTNDVSLDQDIRGIKDPVAIPSSWSWLWWVLGATMLAALAWYAWRKWGRSIESAKPAVVIPPHRRAKDRLRAAHELLSDPYQFCILVSDVVRVYLEERFTLHAPDRTTEEFLEEMRTSPHLLPEQKEMLEQFLTRCDLVKFARQEPTEAELRELLEAALRLIDETTVTAEESQAPTKAEANR